ncbi:MAG TPA: sulfotransferase [Acidisoma sp.]|uniref:tetratricopeptide repeat-containing sulfotransferase family protein n=1 Tax=Acidisoma sp. TaxID=1872115 RepID=UPI002C066242|nr:sulfotransferase [Acidisoma sp.]HTI00029.1 sulfotransferase [Acidisoma sp.]
MARLCVCGSGLRPRHCCDWRPAERTRASALHRLLPLVAEAQAALVTGDTGRAEELLVDLLELTPDSVAGLALLADIRQRQNRPEAAEALLRRVALLDPNNLPALLALAMALFSRGRMAEAEAQARNAIRVAPINAQAHNVMAMIMTEAGRPQTGEYHYRRVLDLAPGRDPILLANLAWNLKSQGRMEEARRLYRESLSLAPTVRQTLLGFARLEEADRRFDAARALLDVAEIAYPGDPQLSLTRATLLGREGESEAAVALIDGMAQERPGGLGPAELLEKGRLLDRLGRYEDAWAAFAEGKARALALSGQSYAPDGAEREIARLSRFYVASRLALLPRAAPHPTEPQPIFILGFPRSGTTLLEQSLSAHPLIAAGDELPLVQELTHVLPRLLGSTLGYPEALSELWMGDQRQGLDLLRDVYLQKVRQMGVLRPGIRHFTDKMPLNETHLGLIGLVFPHSPLLHVVRHPLDVMVSAFSNHFTHGFHCASALETAALHYARIMDLVAHYRAEMPALRYRMVRYEQVIGNQVETITGMLEFLGLDFDPACITFHENRRYARTASYAQVTEPLYDRSVGRWRHYRRQLEPVLPILAALMERLGYEAG